MKYIPFKFSAASPETSEPEPSFQEIPETPGQTTIVSQSSLDATEWAIAIPILIVIGIPIATVFITIGLPPLIAIVLPVATRWLEIMVMGGDVKL
jgi:hypothetical protein